MNDLVALNGDLARVLGVDNVGNVLSVTLGDVPRVTVERCFLPGPSGGGLVAGIKTVITEHQLMPSEPKEVPSP